MPSIFSKIIAGEIPCYKVAESSEYFAFLDINPVQKGHCLVVPKKEIDYLFDLDDATLTGLMVFAKRVALALEKVVSCERIGMTVLGLEVPHAHVHLVPLDERGTIRFSDKKQIGEVEMKAIAAAISQAFDEDQG
ncbi:HIT family protein [Chitinophagales bacterium]|nr:HIT family protein [Chitinophagales bacterium]